MHGSAVGAHAGDGCAGCAVGDLSTGTRRCRQLRSFSCAAATALKKYLHVILYEFARGLTFVAGASLLTGLRPDTHGVLDLQTHVRDRHASLTTLPQAFRRAGYLAVSYGKVYHQFLDDAPSWSTQDEFADGHRYRGLRGAAWSRAGGWSRGWS